MRQSSYIILYPRIPSQTTTVSSVDEAAPTARRSNTPASGVRGIPTLAPWATTTIADSLAGAMDMAGSAVIEVRLAHRLPSSTLVACWTRTPVRVPNLEIDLAHAPSSQMTMTTTTAAARDAGLIPRRCPLGSGSSCSRWPSRLSVAGMRRFSRSPRSLPIITTARIYETHSST